MKNLKEICQAELLEPSIVVSGSRAREKKWLGMTRQTEPRPKQSHDPNRSHVYAAEESAEVGCERDRNDAEEFDGDSVRGKRGLFALAGAPVHEPARNQEERGAPRAVMRWKSNRPLIFFSSSANCHASNPVAIVGNTVTAAAVRFR